MTKRHTKQNKKQALGQYFTTNVDTILAGFETYISDKDVVDPFAGGWDLLNWAKLNGAVSVSGYDIDPKTQDTEQRDSLYCPADYTGKLVLTNPPYLSANKSKGKYKDIFAKWQQNDLYKCFLSSLYEHGAEEAIVIIPSNFWCESSAKARTTLFSNYDVVFAKYWREQIFDDATTGVTAFLLKKKTNISDIQTFECLIIPENKKITMILDKRYGYIHGGHELHNLNREYVFDKVTNETLIVNTNIVVGCLDHGKYNLGFHYNNGSPIKAPKTVITTFQVNTNGFILTDEQQLKVIETANNHLHSLRNDYDSMFLSNYMGAKQKIMSVNIAKSLLSSAVSTLFGNDIRNNVSSFESLFEISQ